MLPCFGSLAVDVISGHKKEKFYFFFPASKKSWECVTFKQFFILNTLSTDMENVKLPAHTF